MKWTLFSEQMPEEKETVFAKWYGTDKWKDIMYRTARYKLLFTVAYNGKRDVVDGRIIDGKPTSGLDKVYPNKVEYIAWTTYPDPFEE